MPALFAVLARVLWGALLTILPSLVGRILLALGLTYVTYTGTDLAITYVETQIQSNLSSMPAGVIDFLAWCYVDKAIAMLFSTYTVCLTYKLAGTTAIKKIVMK